MNELKDMGFLEIVLTLAFCGVIARGLLAVFVVLFGIIKTMLT